MKSVVTILGVLQIIGGVGAFMEAASAIHEILGAVAFGLGSVCIGLATVIGRLDNLPWNNR